ncbi:hypothetical protein BDV10DRAFT_165040 [Aspergillus recurvatus]
MTVTLALKRCLLLDISSREILDRVDADEIVVSHLAGRTRRAVLVIAVAAASVSAVSGPQPGLKVDDVTADPM